MKTFDEFTKLAERFMRFDQEGKEVILHVLNVVLDQMEAARDGTETTGEKHDNVN